MDMQSSEQYNALKRSCDELSKENVELKQLLAREIEKNTLNTRSTYGRKTERFMDMVDEAYNKAEDFDDESPEEESGDDGFGSRETSKVKNVIAFSSSRSSNAAQLCLTIGNG